MEYWDLLNEANARPVMRTLEWQKFMYGYIGLQIMQYPRPGTEARSIKTRRYKLVGELIHRHLGMVILNIAKSMRQTDIEIQKATQEMLTPMDISQAVKAGIRRSKRLKARSKIGDAE